MDKDNKYYDIIANIIKNHRKYAGCEPILDDIIDDVYKHSQAVINSVNDEGVLLSYLQKVVAVSIITVPKRLNFHSDIKHRSITTQADIINKINQPSAEQTAAPEIQSNIVEEEIKPQEISPKANVDFVDKMINTIDTDSVLTESPIEKEPELEEYSDFEELLNEDTEDLDVAQVFDNDDDSEVETNDILIEDEENSQPEEEFESFDTESEEILSDNLIDNTETEDTLTEKEVDTIEIDDEDTSIENEASTIEPLENSLVEDEIDTQESEDILKEDSDNVSETKTEDEFTEDNIVEDSLTEETEVLEELPQEEDIEVLELVSDNAESIEEPSSFETDNNSFDLDLNEDTFVSADEELSETGLTDNFETLEDNSDIQEFKLTDNDEEYSFDNDFNAENSFDITEEEGPKNEASDTIQERNYKHIDYSMFDYTPANNNNPEVEEIEAKLNDLNNKKPELNILKVFDLKYKQNLSVANIAEELQIDKQDVITALDEIVDLI